MNADRRKRLDDVVALLAVAGDLLELPITYERHQGVRIILGVAQQTLTAVHDEDESLTRAAELLAKALGSYTGFGVRHPQLRALIEGARSEIDAARMEF